MSLGDFLQNDDFGKGNWADDDLPTTFSSPLPSTGASNSGRSGDGWTRVDPSSAEYRRGGDRDPVPIPDSAPFTARLLNLDYEVSEDNIKELLADGEKYKVASIRLPRDSATGRLRGYGFVEFETRDSLVEALKLDGTPLLNRSLRVVVSERREDDKFGGDWRAGAGFGGERRGSRDDNRDYDNWERRGPPQGARGGDRGDRGDRPPRQDDGRDYDNWDKRVAPEDIPSRYRRSNFDGERGERSDRPPREDDSRDYGNWERRGPLPPAEGDNQQRRRSSQPRERDDGRNYDNWERRGPSEGGAAPQRRDNRDREQQQQPAGESDNNNDWRTNRTPNVNTSNQRRRKLELKPRTVGAHDATPAAADNRSSLFGSARPVDTTKKLEEAAEKYVQQEHERFEAEQKHRKDIKAREEEKARKDEAKAEQLRKRFEILKTEGDEEGSDEEETAAASSAAADTATEEQAHPKDTKTTAETVLNAEATPEELESGDWNVVPNKSRGRK